MALFAAMLTGCASGPSAPVAMVDPHLPSFSERREELERAAARARAAGDFRPYPEGWPDDALPLHPNPKIAQSIRVGQTMSEVAKVMGQSGMAATLSRRQCLNGLRRLYRSSRSSYRLPEDVGEIAEHLPTKGRFVSWEFQGFPSTSDWVVVYFASPDKEPEVEPRVVSRGVYKLGDMFQSVW